MSGHPKFFLIVLQQICSMKIYLDNRGMYLKNLHFEWKLLRLFLGKVVHFALQDQYQPLYTLFAKNLTIYSPDICCSNFISSHEDDQVLQTRLKKIKLWLGFPYKFCLQKLLKQELFLYQNSNLYKFLQAWDF